MTDKTTPSTESDTADATRKRATGASVATRRRAARRRAGRPDAAAPAARPRAAADEPRRSCAVAEREDAARQETAAVLADIARRYQAAGPGQAGGAARGDRGAVAG